MSAQPLAANAPRSAHRSVLRARIGLVIAAALAVTDIVSFAPDAVRQLDASFIAITVLCVVSLAALPAAWLGASWARITVVVTCLLPALSGVPAFFIAGIPTAGVVAAAAGLVLAFTVAVLVLGARRPSA